MTPKIIQAIKSFKKITSSTNTKPLSKKAASELWMVLATAIIIILIVIIIVFWFNKSGGKVFETVDENILDLKDCDKDGVLGSSDKCPCTNFGKSENSEAKGCPKGKEATECTDQEKKECDQNIITELKKQQPG